MFLFFDWCLPYGEKILGVLTHGLGNLALKDESEVLDEEPLCVISKPTKLSPLAVVWTLVWWELVCRFYLFVVMVAEEEKKKPPPTQLPLGSREAGGQVIQRRCVMGSSLSMPRIGGMCQLCNWRLGMAAISCSPQVILPWDHPPKPINVFLKPQLGERTVGDKKKKKRKKSRTF